MFISYRLIYYVVLRVQFSRVEYVGSEANGFLPVVLVLSGGRPSRPFNVIVNPSELFPPSAIGQYNLLYLMFKHTYCSGNGVDFDSNPIIATFTPSSRQATVQIPLTRDTQIEPRPEMFNLNLMLNTTIPSIRLGSISTARGIIEDSTGKVAMSLTYFAVIHVMIMLLNILHNSYNITELLSSYVFS